MGRRREPGKFLRYLLQCFIQGQDDALLPYLALAGQRHDLLVEELGKPTEREFKFYVAGKNSGLADILIEMTVMLDSEPRKPKTRDAVPKTLFA